MNYNKSHPQEAKLLDCLMDEERDKEGAVTLPRDIKQLLIGIPLKT